MLRILLVTDTEKALGELRQSLGKRGHTLLPDAATAPALARLVEGQSPDLVLVDAESPLRDTLEQMAVMNRNAPRTVQMGESDADQRLLAAALALGVSVYGSHNATTAAIAPVLALIVARLTTTRPAVRVPVSERPVQVSLR
ncbi:AmiR/NasT family two-component response regulator [Silvimonas terrae]|uniref:AmiR/NasT family two-component response regulator n=1 Tax=Silvimonas terrae TaxID=300266 RepID=A0A840RMH3_9NEIS|nr:hypothetical protein [Silvimonas terrae]MBB5193392.1 AmiR/NasT family two-component response regulator [Silvimonas terrae]